MSATRSQQSALLPAAWIERILLRLHKLRAAFPTGSLRSLWSKRGDSFLSLRAYQPGDAVRHLDWKATARHGIPIVRTFQPEQHFPLWVIIEAAPSLFSPRRSHPMGRVQPHQFSAKVETALLWLARLEQWARFHSLPLGLILLQPLQPDYSVFWPAKSGAAEQRLLLQQAAESLLQWSTHYPGKNQLHLGESAATQLVAASAWINRRLSRPGFLCFLSDFWPPEPAQTTNPVGRSVFRWLFALRKPAVQAETVWAQELEMEWLRGWLPLRRQRPVLAMHLIDSAESSWPDAALVRVASSTSSRTVLFDTADRHAQERWHRFWQQRQLRLQQQLLTWDIDYFVCPTTQFSLQGPFPSGNGEPDSDHPLNG